MLAISADDPGAWSSKLDGPPHDVEAIIAALIETGFSQSDVIVLHNPDRRQIEKAIADIAQAFSQQSFGEASGRLAVVTPTSIIRVGFTRLQEISAPENTLFLFFFSGHGVNVGGTEYILPKLLGPTDPNGSKDIENYAISVNWLKKTLEHSAAASVIILDTHFPTYSWRAPTR